MIPRLNIFCLPFAGGNKYSYREYKESEPSFINFICLEYPGRSSRIKEPLFTEAHELVNDLYKIIINQIDDGDYAIYGHSLGGLLTYLLTRKLKENGHKLPVHLFITGTTGPSSKSRGEKKRHLLPKRDFIQELKDLNGMPDEILQNDELLDYYEPILRSDFMASENYIYEDCSPLNIPITVITGTEEEMEQSDIKLWQKETTHIVEFISFPGNHFFIYKYAKGIIQIISKKLLVTTKVYQL
ncbi:MAG TPA: thioesterase domain-containing protein [Chitinophagaceae bacterium]|nr:thioesterase domain-containing protein [Chitinophagaceae bacterium]